MNINGQKIEMMLAEKDMTQALLAEKSGLSRQSINVIIRRGTCVPKNAGKIAKGLGVPVSDIIAKEA